MIVEHNPQLYENDRDMSGRVARAMKQASRETTILLYSPVLDWHLEILAEFADRVFCFYDTEGELGQRQSRSISEELASQTTWEAFS